MNNSENLKLSLVIIFSLIFLSSCSSQTEQAPSPSPKLPKVVTTTVTPALLITQSTRTPPSETLSKPMNTYALSKADGQIPVQTNTPKPTRTPTPTQIPYCPGVNPDVLFEIPNNPEDLESYILKYLSVGGDPNKIQQLIDSSQGYPVDSSVRSTIDSILIEDLDLDSVKEIAVSSTNLNLYEAKVSIFHCGTYDYRLADSQILGYVDFADIQFSERLFNNKPPFLIIRGLCEAGWCEYYYAIGWSGTDWQTLDLGIGFFSKIALFDQNGDRTQEVFIQSYDGFRYYVDTYEWNGTKFEEVNSVSLPGSSRLDYINDAEKALSERNPLLAIANYEIAARNDSLLTLPTGDELLTKTTELAEPYQRSYAYFRIIALWLFLDRPDLSEKYIQEMSEKYPDGVPGHEFVLAANELSSSYKSGTSFQDACSKAVSFLDDQYPDVVKNHLSGWSGGIIGPAIFKTADICEYK